VFVTTAELAAYLGRDDSPTLLHPLEMAQALIEGFLGGSVEDRTVTESHKLFYDLDGDEVLVVRDGPIRSVTSLTINDGDTDEDADVDELIVKPWTISRADGFTKNTTLEIVFEAGWEPNASDGAATQMPKRMRQALMLVAAEIVQRPQQNIKSETIGDYSYTLEETQEGVFGLSERTRVMLEKWRKADL
jgi:hypothetical protein